MNGRAVIILLAVLLLVGGCAAVDVSQDYRPGSDFSKYHTYRWKSMSPVTSPDIRVNNPLLQERFRNAIENGLAACGYAPAAAPDFLVSYDYSIQTRIETDPAGTSFGYGWGRYYRYGGIGYGTVLGVWEYEVEILVIDFFDASSGEPLWRGTGSELLSSRATPEETTARVRGMVDAILGQFPPR